MRGTARLPLIALLGSVALSILAWSWLTPVFEAPDENAHVAWTQHFAETGHFGGPGSRPGYASTEIAAAIADSQSDFVAANPLVQPARDRRSYERWLHTPFSHAQRADAAGPNPADSNPDLYYVLASGPYELAGGADFFTRVLLMRALGVLFGCALAFVGWLLASELIPPGPGRVVAAGVSGLMPMIGFVEGSVSPDSLMYPMWAVVLLAGVRALRGSGRWTIGMLAATLVAIAVKNQSLALLPGVAFVLVVLAHRRLPWPRSSRRRAGALAVALVLAAVAALIAGAHGLLGPQAHDALTAASGMPPVDRFREFLSYLWQYYLPRPSFLHYFGITGGDDFWHAIFTQYIGAFGWHEVRLAEWIYTVSAVVVGLVAIGAVAALVTTRSHRRHLAAIVFFALVSLSLFFTLHYTEYTTLKQLHPFMQGRYFLPLNPLFGIACGLAVGVALARRPRLQGIAAGGLLAGVVMLNVVSLGASLERFYA